MTKALSDDLQPSATNPYPREHGKNVEKIIASLVNMTVEQSRDGEFLAKLRKTFSTSPKPALSYIAAGTVKNMASSANRDILSTRIIDWVCDMSISMNCSINSSTRT